MNREIILATGNPSKAAQISAIFAGSNIRILTQAEAGVRGSAAEDGETLSENALKKVNFVIASQPYGKAIAMADDTGLFIKHLGGAPGAYAACWAGQNAKTGDITKLTLEVMKNATDRSAIFRTVVAIRIGSDDEKYFWGEVEGTILDAPRCAPQPKMPYSGIFLPDGSDKVWAEMTTEEENAISHRGIAFREALEYLQKLLA